MTTTVNDAIVNDLMSGCKAYYTASVAVDKAEAHRDALTDKILLPAVQCGSLESWDAHRKALDAKATTLSPKQKVAMGYREDEREDAGGNKTIYTVPSQALANVFTVIRQSYKRGLELTDKAGKPLSFDRLKKNKKADIDRAAQTATGRQADRRRLAEAFKIMATKAKKLSDEDLHNLANRMEAEAKALPVASKAA